MTTTSWRPAPRDLEAARGAVHVWRVPLSGEPSAIAARAALLDTDELGRMRRYRFAVHRRRFAMRRSALRMILGRYLGVDPRAVAFAYSRHGKPEVEQAGGAPRLRFNLSDSEDLALVAVTLADAIGVDVERLRAVSGMGGIARDHFAPREYARYRAIAPAARIAAFYNCWTRKEAWLKARGDGLIAGLDGFEVTLAEGSPARLLLVRGEPGEEKRWTLRALEPLPGYVGALAVARRDPVISKFAF